MTLEDVRNILAEKSNSGFILEVKQLIAKFGGDRLSDIILVAMKPLAKRMRHLAKSNTFLSSER